MFFEITKENRLSVSKGGQRFVFRLEGKVLGKNTASEARMIFP
jgi:hypothetical protein